MASGHGGSSLAANKAYTNHPFPFPARRHRRRAGNGNGMRYLAIQVSLASLFTIQASWMGS